MQRDQIRNSIKKWVAELEFAEVFADWIVEHRIKVVVTRSRKTKRATYMPPQRGHGHKITLNNDLNPHGFAISFIHEMAHLITWQEYENTVNPHGQEWKDNFKKLISPFLHVRYFPEDILVQLTQYMSNPAASSCSDESLMKALDKYNLHEDGLEYLENLPINSIFALKDGRVFKKGKKLRKYYQCEEHKSRNLYRVSPVARVRKMGD